MLWLPLCFCIDTNTYLHARIRIWSELSIQTHYIYTLYTTSRMNADTHGVNSDENTNDIVTSQNNAAENISSTSEVTTLWRYTSFTIIIIILLLWAMMIVWQLTLSSPVVSNGYISKCSGPYWSNPPFLIFWHSGTLALSRERQSARMSKN